MIKKISLAVFMALIFLNSCYKPSASQSMDDLKKLAGSWSSTEGVLFNEHWQVENDCLMIGLGFSLSANDTVFKEVMKIYRQSDSIYFAALVEENKNYIAFKLVESGANYWKFINPTHDYPNIIYYEIENDTLLNAYTANIRGNKKVEFHLKKHKNELDRFDQ